MSLTGTMMELIIPFIPLLITSAVVGVSLWVAQWLLIARHPDIGNERLFPRHLIMLGLTLASVVAVAFSLPVSESSRHQIIAVVGLVISGLFAFSSSTIFANLMAGIMLRVTKPFRTGDFIRVGDHFGRVVERGLLDTEIQTEDRDLAALPNTFMITHPVYVTRSSGTIVSTTLSLGYDIHHSKVESLLVEAATDCELEDPFVQILDLGNDAVTYKVSGMLTDIKNLLTARSHLRCHILETLHGNGVEILSPAFMNQRRLAQDWKAIPVGADAEQKSPPRVSAAEEVVFDKAEQAEQVENEKQQLLDQIRSYKSDFEGASGPDRERIQGLIDECEEKVKGIEQRGVEEDREANGAEKRS